MTARKKRVETVRKKNLVSDPPAEGARNVIPLEDLTPTDDVTGGSGKIVFGEGTSDRPPSPSSRKKTRGRRPRRRS